MAALNSARSLLHFRCHFVHIQVVRDPTQSSSLVHAASLALQGLSTEPEAEAQPASNTSHMAIRVSE